MEKIEKQWYGNPAQDKNLESEREIPSEVEETANGLINKYFEKQRTNAVRAGVAGGGLVEQVSHIEDTTPEGIQEFADEYNTSPNLVRGILKELERRRH